jgi:hypothetical protein
MIEQLMAAHYCIRLQNVIAWDNTLSMLCCLMSIPEFNELGYLPPGVHDSSWQEFLRRFATNSHRLRLVTGLAAALHKLGRAGCNRVIIGGSFVTDKECPNDFDGCYEDFCLDGDILDPLFVEDVDQQQAVFGGRLFDIPSYEGFFQTDRAGRPKGVIALDPQELLQ